ncbi:uncharacterized protein MELLADRAFT_73157 [Melampsora larici-populina 98AG31]|uniref:Uncharacterized protein n=1 Tax=Melampsora larici-populina (strain 98AG31 / pathotype 3-4-7) TaxID=747676 RepID=F4S4D3_MELLP|nr:uncharacterized protein MELLADRAFT_73157 [Melampsora larici-populina 98AG31]EGG00509.1 hypothetical protein MELLADRAFT_73157 [Melampsora larici-populina 98AG31]
MSGTHSPIIGVCSSSDSSPRRYRLNPFFNFLFATYDLLTPSSHSRSSVFEKKKLFSPFFILSNDYNHKTVYLSRIRLILEPHIQSCTSPIINSWILGGKVRLPEGVDPKLYRRSTLFLILVEKSPKKTSCSHPSYKNLN